MKQSPIDDWGTATNSCDRALAELAHKVCGGEKAPREIKNRE